MLASIVLTFLCIFPKNPPGTIPVHHTMLTTTLVVGATGATGKHVVLQLLQQKQNVRAVARSKQRLLDALDEILPNSSSDFADHLEVTEASILDLSEDELNKATCDCDAVVTCLGHNIDFKGIFFPPQKLVTEATQRLIKSIEANQTSTPHAPNEGDDDDNNSKKRVTKFILMGTVAVSNPAGGDNKRTFGERIVLFLLRYLLPPHSDNETAAEYIYTKMDNPQLEWTVVRPTDLINGPVSNYELFTKPNDPLFGGEGVATRANVAKCMVDMILTEKLWEEWKFKMPVIHDLN